MNGKPVFTLGIQNFTGNGINYLHLRSKATAIDTAGFLVESVSVDITGPVAPALTAQQQQDWLNQYIPSYYTPPPERGGSKSNNAHTETPDVIPIG